VVNKGKRRAEAATPRPDKRRARGRIEHTLLDEGRGLHPNRPKTIARNPTIPKEVADVSIYDKGPFPSGKVSFVTL
jgi:hypothetical protein